MAVHETQVPGYTCRPFLLKPIRTTSSKYFTHRGTSKSIQEKLPTQQHHEDLAELLIAIGPFYKRGRNIGKLELNSIVAS